MTDPTPEQARNVDLVRDGLGSWIEGDRETTMRTFAEDIEVFVPAELGNAGTYHGLEGFQSWISSWDDAWSDFRMELNQMEAVGDRHVVAEVSNTGVGIGSGVEVGNTLGWVFSVSEDGRLDYLSLQPDLEAAREHARERETGGA